MVAWVCAQSGVWVELCLAVFTCWSSIGLALGRFSIRLRPWVTDGAQAWAVLLALELALLGPATGPGANERELDAGLVAAGVMLTQPSLPLRALP